MLDTENAEPMDYTDQSEDTPMSDDKYAENKEEVQLSIAVEWSNGFLQQKLKVELEKILQSWANNDDNTFSGDCKVLGFNQDESAVVSFKPAPAQSELQKLIGKELKGRDEKKIVKIKSVSSTLREVNTPALAEASINLPPASVSEQHDEVQLPVQHGAVSIAGEEAGTCSVPLHHFWYINHIYKKEIKRIEEENGVQIVPEVNVTFQGDQKDGSPPQKKACSEFISLVQKCLGESDGSIIPLKRVNSEEWKDTVNIIQRKENKLLLTVSSEEITIHGPRQSQDLIKKSLSATTNTSIYVGESTWPSQDKPPNIGMSIKDPLANAGLTMEESHWKQMTTSFGEQVAEIRMKFKVDFRESFTSQGKVKVKAYNKNFESNASMESHAVRALLQLYQKIATSPLSFTRQNGVIGLMQIEGASGGPGSGGHSGYDTGAPPGGGATEGGATGPSGYYTEARTEGGATGGGGTGPSRYDTGAPTGSGATGGNSEEDEKCPICIDTFTNKRSLKCKHEFCGDCLKRSRQSIGPICPVCKDVFGLMEGDQPRGKMTTRFNSSSLLGFPNCGTITINYNIPSGIQTEKHPNPGKHYSGITRTAYLPDNKEGKEVLQLLKKAFEQRLIFTVGTSVTTGMENQVTWNDIHHKTNHSGGAACFGYPDPAYLSRVKEELKAKGIV
ncbi:E3 ubiquitin-protein ligase DTX3L isoform X2 [Clinocottus analis]|uniref:E3 ubiquitin-protein ligase DTX3L isoform X2 n=1 Tax=Clinocottus analis TaxID=304258 RepID=UPI0035C1A4EA